MKLFTIAILVLCTLTITAQKKPKIKGNKEVTEVHNTLDSFTELEVTDGLKVFLSQTDSTSYRLKTDSNLVDVITFEIFEGKLKISTLNTISSSKKLEIYLTFTSLKKITVGNDAQIEGQNTFILEDTEILCADGSNFEMEIKGNNLKLQMNGNAKGDLELTCKETSMVLNDNAYLKGIVSTENFYLNANKRADMKIKGSSNTLNMSTTSSADVDARKLKTNSAIINAADSSKIRVYASTNLNIFAKGKSDIYVYGKPEINVEALNGKSQIIKK